MAWDVSTSLQDIVNRKQDIIRIELYAKIYSKPFYSYLKMNSVESVNVGVRNQNGVRISFNLECSSDIKTLLNRLMTIYIWSKCKTGKY